MVRCCICGRKLTAKDSVARGIGPICAGKMKEEALLSKAKREDGNCKVCGGNLITGYTKLYDDLKLPCNNYCCSNDHCPFARENACPRERVYIKSDIYPLYKHKEKFCSFCGDKITAHYRMHKSKSKITLECSDCRKKNESWRNGIKPRNRIHIVKWTETYLTNQEKYRI